MNLTPVTIPKVVKSMFPDFVWNIDSTQKTLYLTFDDGPTPEITDWVLDCLKSYNAKATFFCIGNNVEKYPEIFRRIIDEGHSVGNHTQNHLKGWKTKIKNYIENVILCDLVLKSQIPKNNSQEGNSKIINHQSLIFNLFRPPYGRLKPKQGKALIKNGYKIIMWSVLSLDWDKNLSTTQCYNNVVKKAVSGDIIVFHDSIKASKNMRFALPKVLEYFSEKGFEFKRIPE